MHAQQVNEIRSQHIEAQDNTRKEWMKAKEASEETLKTQCKSLEKQLSELFEKHQLVTSEKKQLETKYLTLCGDHKHVQEGCQNNNEALKALRGEVKTLESVKFEQEKQIHTYALQFAALQQQVKDKNEICHHNEMLARVAQEQKVLLYTYIYIHIYISKKKTRECVKEINKGNAIISRLQNELRLSKSESKRMEQQLVVIQNDLDSDRTKHQSLSQDLLKKENTIDELRKEVESLKHTLTSCKEKLEQAHQAIESNQRVIAYLNKQVHEKQLGGNVFAQSHTKHLTSLHVAHPSSSNPLYTHNSFQHDAFLRNRCHPQNLAGESTATSFQKKNIYIYIYIDYTYTKNNYLMDTASPLLSGLPSFRGALDTHGYPSVSPMFPHLLRILVIQAKEKMLISMKLQTNQSALILIDYNFAFIFNFFCKLCLFNFFGT
ncbi:hypothetical protein RFI_22255 [Reticulomyxa filosa]|uniref:Uncharacterized protein n=1 Tax=Reticulomyxa filosa TaxID=46433 RepID=X6MML9_RETFI|nr:hypothetical protein RFI_22255 [Reticulomyxa filosa]|eukprot:ETO15109.1 hypothetical protein RFI_22255 [Reticulomyxa filosa]